jgi:aminobenzoyl-glutamate transport protein
MSRASRWLDAFERVGNKLPDPSALFVLLTLAAIGASALLSGVPTGMRDARSGEELVVLDQFTFEGLIALGTSLVRNFAAFPPLGLVLVAMLGLGVADHSGFISTSLRSLLGLTPRKLLSPIVIAAGILSHSAVDAGFVLVIPLGALVFAAAGRHPLAGLAAGFAGVSGGFSANPVPSSLDALVQGITQSAVAIVDPARAVNPLCNWWFNGTASVFVLLAGWWITDVVVEPRARRVPIDGAGESLELGRLSERERSGLWLGHGLLAVLSLVLVWLCARPNSALRGANGSLTAHDAPLMQLIVPLLFLAGLVSGVAYGWRTGRYRSHRDVMVAFTKSMEGMASYLVMAFFAAQFIAVFLQSNLGALVATRGAQALRALELSPQLTALGVIAISAGVNLLIGSCSAKWALLAPVLVPMGMQLGLSPELVQGAYRIGDSTTNIITPLMPYFPLVVTYCQRHCKSCGIGTLSALMLPYASIFLTLWSALLLLFWQLGIPLGPGAPYDYP